MVGVQWVTKRAQGNEGAHRRHLTQAGGIREGFLEEEMLQQRSKKCMSQVEPVGGDMKYRKNVPGQGNSKCKG